MYRQEWDLRDRPVERLIRMVVLIGGGKKPEEG